MKYLFDEWKKIKKHLKGENIFLFFDYDGTLTPIVEHPNKAVLSQKTKNLLRKIVRNPKSEIAIISGRSMKDIKSRIGIKEIIYSGNHGLEIESPLFKYENNVLNTYKTVLSEIKKKLQHALLGFKGTLIEDKELSLSIHYRLVDHKHILNIKKILYQTITHYLESKQIKSGKGKMVLEITPPIKWNKGNAVLWILNQHEISKYNFYPIYFGDDATDEDAFIALKNKGITVLVGNRKKTHAQYYLNNVTEVEKFLEQL